VTINTISHDNMLNAAEAAQDLTLSGTSTAEAGQTVTVTFNGNQYTAQVQADGSWTLDVPAADMAGIADGSAAVTATVSDKAGNPASAGLGAGRHHRTADFVQHRRGRRRREYCRARPGADRLR
jgi:hypothetical protein